MKDLTKIITGKAGEKIALSFLEKNGYQILDTNYRCRAGEIDIVARENGDLVLVEVKARKSLALGYPEQAVGKIKQKKLSQLALWYMEANHLADIKVRFDVVAVTIAGPSPDIRLIKDAFDFIS